MKDLLENEEFIIKELDNTYKNKKFNFLHNAFVRNKNYDNYNFLLQQLNNFNIECNLKNKKSSYDIGVFIYNSINKENIENIIMFTFFCFKKIANQTVDRLNPITKKKKIAKKSLLKQINSEKGTCYQMHSLRKLFINLKLLNNDFEFGRNILEY